MRKSEIGFGLLIILSLVSLVIAQNTNVVDLTNEVADYYVEVTRGNVKGHSTINKFGANYDIGNSPEVIWEGGGDYNWLDNPVFLQVSSSDVDDTNGGSGAWNVTLSGLDENWLEYSETVTLNGQTPVNTTGEFIRINRVIVEQSGATNYNEGTIYISTGTKVAGVPSDSTQVYAQVRSEHGQSLMAIYTVPADKKGFLVKGFITSDGSKPFYAHYYNRPFGGSRNVKFDFDFERDFIYEFKPVSGPLQPKTDLWVEAEASTAGTSKVSGGFDLVLIDI